jgi:hypothetical protein
MKHYAVCMSVFLWIYEPVDRFNDFYYECRAIGNHPNFLICSFHSQYYYGRRAETQ